ncbi:MAG: MarC family protein [Burkholderiaceae bacterium]|jgi:multiple antibiotic resistance protein|nr:MarC family protein [Burkholderiaceae bacterium]
MDEVLSTFLYVYASFIPVLNPFSGAMFFLALTSNVDDETCSVMVRRIVFYSAIMLFMSLFAGHIILNFFGISLAVLRVAGGLVLISAGWKALNEAAHDEDTQVVAPRSRAKLLSMAFYPITMPLTIGPGMISVATALGTSILGEGVYSLIGLIAATLATLLTVFLCYRYSHRVSRAMGATGMDALARVFAFILLCIGIAVFWAGFSELWLTLPK